MPCVVRYHWDRVRYYNEFCNDGKSFCYWYVALVGGRRVWKLLHKDCECPCDCEDPERVGYNKHNLQVFSGECPNYLTPDRGLGDVSELPEDLQKEKLPSTHFVKTKCTYAIKDCKINFVPYESPLDRRIYYEPVVTYQYHDKLPCTYIDNRYTCTEQEFVRCQNPAYVVTYRIDTIPEEDFVKLGLEEAPCNIEIRCYSDDDPISCNFKIENVIEYRNALSVFFNNAGFENADFLYDEPRLFPLSALRPENRALFEPFLPKPIQIDKPRIDYSFWYYRGLSYFSQLRRPPSREPRPEENPVGSCLYIITSTGAKYVYHTCSEGQRCPEIDWRRGQVKGCPEKDYIITIINCEDSQEGSTTTTPQPRFPFCAWESAPLRGTFTYYELGESETHGGGLFVKRVIQEVREAKYYDIKVSAYASLSTRPGYYVLQDPYRHGRRRICEFIVGPYFMEGLYFIENDKDGNVKPLHIHLLACREDTSTIIAEEIRKLLDEHHKRCGSSPFCRTPLYNRSYSIMLEDHNKLRILPGIEASIPLHERGGQALRAYGFSYLQYVTDFYGYRHYVYFFDPSLFVSGPDRYCRLRYDGYTWIASGTCDRCGIYVEMLNHIMKVCFRKKRNSFLIERAPFPLSGAPWYFRYKPDYERIGTAYFEASRYTCQCTVGDVVRFLNQVLPFEIYLTCPLDLPDSDYFYIEIHGKYEGRYQIFLPCGATKAPITLPDIDLGREARDASYLLPCVESTGVECEFQDAQRIVWALVPRIYQPCLCREWPPS